MKLNRKGFTLVEIMIVVAIIALLAAIAIPSFMKSRMEARKSACINSLRLIDHAKEQLATATGIAEGAAIAVPQNLWDYLKSKQSPVCPSGAPGTYTIGIIGVNPLCDNNTANTALGHALPAIAAP